MINSGTGSECTTSFISAYGYGSSNCIVQNALEEYEYRFVNGYELVSGIMDKDASSNGIIEIPNIFPETNWQIGSTISGNVSMRSTDPYWDDEYRTYWKMEPPLNDVGTFNNGNSIYVYSFKGVWSI